MTLFSQNWKIRVSLFKKLENSCWNLNFINIAFWSWKMPFLLNWNLKWIQQNTNVNFGNTITKWFNLIPSDVKYRRMFFLNTVKKFKIRPTLKIYFTKWHSFVSGSPLAATTTATTSSTPFSTSTSNILDRLSLPPYKPNHLPQKAEELLKTLVNPIGKKIKLGFSLCFLM